MERIAQGVAAAIVTPSSLALIGAIYPEDERNRAIGIWAAASALTTAGGPILGGWLTLTFGWQAVFWINPPIALAAIAVLMVFAEKDWLEERQFDIPGAIVLALALGTFAWILSSIGPTEVGAREGTFATSGTALALAAIAGVLSLVAYIVWERTTKHPMTPPHVFANKKFTGLNAATLLIYAAMSIMFFLLPFELVDRRGLSPMQAGMTFLPLTLGIGLLSHLFGGLADKIGARLPLIAGPLGASVAYVMMAGLRDAPIWLSVVVPMAVLGLAFALLVAPLTGAVMSSVGKEDEGRRSCLRNEQRGQPYCAIGRRGLRSRGAII
jgi:MFS family permease